MSDKSVMMTLGQFEFSIATAAYKSLKRTTEYRWAEQARLSTHPMVQYVGPGKDEIQLEGVIYPHYWGGLKQIDTMRQQANQGTGLLLTDGLGTVHGKWVITKIEEKQGEFLRQGQARKIEFSLTLRFMEHA
ncbi:phage tail protein [Algicola sagamiensis]|uniref:phage tail protein n=1 Tax=Algicola sagamiensis TaxID=163869 RepID=UPI000367F13F|nr:phage tail protein [Algicola sagamiensis]